MEWRCEWCGKPHEENDPPCDNCGHGTFESAVVPVGPEGDGETILWICPECGREHPRNSPPCSRCGNMILEPATRAEREVSDDSSAGYLDLLTVREVALATGIILVLGVFVLGQAGVIDLPGAGTGGPAAEDVPGNAEQVGDLSLVAVEDAYVSEFADRRQAVGELPVGPDPRLSNTAAEYNRWLVAADYGDEERPAFEDVYEGGDCPWPVQYANYAVPVEGDTDALGTMDAEAVASMLLDAYEERGGTFDGEASTLGVDVHVAPDGTVYVTHIRC